MRRTTTRFDIKVLMDLACAPTAQAMADRCGLSRKGVHNRICRGITWTEADELAVQCGFLPWEVWPEWADVDPSEWLPPVCATHGNDYVEDLADLSQRCQACHAPNAQMPSSQAPLIAA